MGLEKVADGVWLLRGDFRGAMNIYFLQDGDGVVQFDAGTKSMRKKARAAGEQLGGVKQVVLGHAHADHRGTAGAMGAPVLCHPDEVADAESDAAIAPYMELSELPSPGCGGSTRSCCVAGTAARSRSTAPSPRATRWPASRSSTSPATQRG